MSCRWRDVKLRAFENADHRTYVDLKVNCFFLLLKGLMLHGYHVFDFLRAIA